MTSQLGYDGRLRSPGDPVASLGAALGDAWPWEFAHHPRLCAAPLPLVIPFPFHFPGSRSF